MNAYKKQVIGEGASLPEEIQQEIFSQLSVALDEPIDSFDTLSDVVSDSSEKLAQMSNVVSSIDYSSFDKQIQDEYKNTLSSLV